MRLSPAFILITLLLSPHRAAAQDSLPPALRTKIDAEVAAVLKATGAPGASIAVVRDAAVAYVHAYGLASTEPQRPATPQMRYSIGSISKQFTAAALLMLQEEGKLSLDDRISRWLPDLTRADDVTIRQLLSMTSGYQDFWPQDYVPPEMLAEWREKDPIERYGERLVSDFGFERAEIDEIRSEVSQYVDECARKAVDSPMPDPEIAAHGVFAEEATPLGDGAAPWSRFGGASEAI